MDRILRPLDPDVFQSGLIGELGQVETRRAKFRHIFVR